MQMQDYKNLTEERELLAWALLRAPNWRVGRYLRARPGKRKDKRRAWLIAWAKMHKGVEA